jgi:nicotinate-nucleotide adenylyltransferase
LFITSPNPPHRHHDLLDGELRHELVSAAVAQNPHFESSRIELERSGPSYTVDTLEALRKQYPTASLNLIIGEDNLPFIARWYRAADIFAAARIVVAPRQSRIVKPTDPQEAGALPPNARLISLDLPHVNVSSSQIRQRLRAGESIKYLVPHAVNDIMQAKRLFLA